MRAFLEHYDTTYDTCLSGGGQQRILAEGMDLSLTPGRA